jgi:hypothetical protein
MAFQVHQRLLRFGMVAFLVAALAACVIRTNSQSARSLSPELQSLREAADHELTEYLRLRDAYDEQFNAAVEKDGDDPKQMLEIIKRFEPIKAKVEEQQYKWTVANEKAQQPSGK